MDLNFIIKVLEHISPSELGIWLRYLDSANLFCILYLNLHLNLFKIICELLTAVIWVEERHEPRAQQPPVKPTPPTSLVLSHSASLLQMISSWLSSSCWIQGGTPPRPGLLKQNKKFHHCEFILLKWGKKRLTYRVTIFINCLPEALPPAMVKLTPRC